MSSSQGSAAMIIKVFLRCMFIFFGVICTQVSVWAAEPLTDEEKIAAIMPIIFGLLDSSPPTPVNGSITVAISNGNDDVEENTATGVLDKTSTDLELVYDGKQQAVGLRFQNAKIPQGATIKNAYIQFRTDEVSSSAVSLTIKGDNADNSAIFNGAYNVSLRPATTASVVWTPAAWAVVDEVSAAQRTPDLSAIVQEIVNRGGWTVNNAMSFIVTGDGSTNKRIADSFEDGWAPKLVVEFEYINKAPVIASIPATVIPKTSAINTQVLTVSANDPDGDTLTYSIEGSVPFAIDATGKITLNAVPQQETHTFNVKVGDGKETTTVPVTVLTLLNVALAPESGGFGVATQSSTYDSSSAASKAIDGNLATTNHTNCLANDWWQVKLPDPTLVSRIVVTGRESWASRLAGAEVYVSANSATNGGMNAGDKVFTLAGIANAQNIPLAAPKSATYVIVKAAPKVSGGTECLHMREVEVYGQGAPTPVFSQSAYTFYLNEKSTQGATAGTVKAVDYQLNPVTYRLVGNVPFAINAQGQITLNGTLNHNLIQNYSFSVEASDGSNVATVPVTVKLGKGNGAWLQRWEGISGTSVDNLLQAAHYKNDRPDYAGSAAALDVKTVSKDNYGQKLTAFLVPAVSGNYQFAIVGDDATQLKLSPNFNASQASKIAENGYGAYQDWNAAGKSAVIALEAGKPYYIETLHKEGTGGDYVSVGWKREGEASFTLIPAGQLYQDAMSVGLVIPAFTAGQRDYLIPWNTASGSIVASAFATDPQGDGLTYSIVGNVPFRVDGQGNVSVDSTLQGGTTYTFDVSVTDGVHNVATTLNITTTSTAAVEEALQSGDVSRITAGELLDATIAELSTKKIMPSLLTALYGSDSIAYTPGNRTQLINFKPWVDSVFPIVVGNQGNTLAVAGTTPTARYAAFGISPMELFQANNSLTFETPFSRLLAWLLAGEPVNNNALIGNRKIALSFVSSEHTEIKAWIAKKYPSWTVTDCNTVATLATCYGSADLVVTGWQGNNADAQTIRQALATVMGAGKPVLYLHTWYEDYNDVAHAIADLLKFSLPYAGNYWADDAANWTNVTAMQTAIWEKQGLAGVEKMLKHFKANDYSIATRNEEFYPGANKVRAVMTLLDENKVNLFQSNESRLYRLLALLGDSYRQEVVFPMDMDATNANVFLKSLFADHAVYNYRTLNPVQADMGNFSRSNFSHITPVTKTVTMTSRQNFRAAGVYALPGKTVRVTRNDNSSTTTKVFINSLRSGSTHEYEAWGYKRPKFLESAHVPIKPGETITLTSPYGGPVQIDFGTNDQTVSFTFEQVGEHPFWDDTSDNADFTAKLAKGDYNWAEFVTPAFEIHSTLEKMRESVSNTRWGGTLEGFAAATMRYIHNFPHVLAGFKGPNIDVVSEIHDFATANGFTIENLDLVKHMNADQATCGSGCSGNPYDAYWAFEPIGHGDIHEMGHGLEKSRFRLDGWNYHASTNPYSYYSKTQYFKTTGGNPDCQNLPFKDAFTALQASVGQANPATYLKTNYWDAVSDNWSRAASMTLQMMMTAEHQGALQDGWHLLARLHILEREFNRARSDATTWDAKKTSLGFASYSKAEADAISSNDWMVIAVSKVTGMDYRDYFNMWGQAYSAKANTQVAGFNHATAERRFFISSSNGYCKGEGFDGNNLPVDGNQAWPSAVPQARLIGDSFR